MLNAHAGLLFGLMMMMPFICSFEDYAATRHAYPPKPFLVF
jgi:hypothetical protein